MKDRNVEMLKTHTCTQLAKGQLKFATTYGYSKHDLNAGVFIASIYISLLLTVSCNNSPFLQDTSWRIKSLIAGLADITPARQDRDNVPARKTGLQN